MKNYLNAADRTRHIIITAMQSVTEDLSKSESLSEDEQNYLNIVYENLLKFNQSLYSRLGEPYKRKILQTMQSNTLRLVGKYSAKSEAISYAASEDLTPTINEVIDLKCCDCQKNNFIDCPVYALGVACDLDSRSKDGCPYRW